jgi:uncharacterized protein (TIGR02246 family)
MTTAVTSRRVRRVVVAMAAVVTLSTGAAGWAGVQNTAATADEVRAAELRRFQVTTARDYEALATLLGDDLVYTHSNALVDSKPSYLESLHKGLVYHTIEPREMKVRVYGDTAIINAEATIITSTGGGEKRPNELRYTDVWVRREGRWQMVAWQSTRLP